MKHLYALTFTLMLALPAQAQDEDSSNLRDGWGLLSEGSRLILEGLMDEMEPIFEEHMLPMLQQLAELMGDMNAYHAPEMLPNGDIIIRRREPLDPAAPGEEGAEAPEEPIDL